MRAMGFRVVAEPHEHGSDYADLVNLALLSESLGFDGFFCSDHLLSIGRHTLARTESWITLAGLALETSRIAIGPLVSATSLRPPGLVAVMAGQVAEMSGGRLEIGVGAGWYQPEHAAIEVGFPGYEARLKLLERQVRMLRGLDPEGGNESSSLFEPLSSRIGFVPLIIGASSPSRILALAASFANELNIGYRDPGAIRAIFELVDEECARVDRQPDTLVRSAAVSVACATREDDLQRRVAMTGRNEAELSRTGVCGRPEEVVHQISEYREAGVQRLYLQIVDCRDLTHLRLLAEHVLPHFARG